MCVRESILSGADPRRLLFPVNARGVGALPFLFPGVYGFIAIHGAILLGFMQLVGAVADERVDAECTGGDAEEGQEHGEVARQRAGDENYEDEPNNNSYGHGGNGIYGCVNLMIYLDQAAVVDFPDLFDELGQEVRAGVVEQLKIMLHILKFPPAANIHRIIIKIIDLGICHRQNKW